MNHPIQPLAADEKGVIRFKANKIVEYLLDNGGIDMNALAQLIGYSLSGFAELSYVRDETYGAAQRMAEHGEKDTQARIAHLEAELIALRQALLEPVARLFGIHPDDLSSHNG